MSSEESTGPPWIAYNPDGSMHMGGVPDRLLHHPEMLRRGIKLAGAMSPGVVFRSIPTEDPQFVVKVVDLDTEELPIYERLLRESKAPRNHTIPCEIYREGHPLLIMPYLLPLDSFVLRKCHSLRRLLQIFQELAEGVEFLHQQHIAHLDICPNNIVASLREHLSAHPNSGLVPERTYIIDFDTSRQLPLGPGDQHAITLPPTQLPPPNDLTYFDPYSWDIYCLGQVYEGAIRVSDFESGLRVVIY
ncbi:hypothetical protein C8Q70DRAFT_1122401 [Cubamyces menziesii]|uniref:Protein kinase domain-containing protein n=1 Tax=Trametes cubensis TaxID=1111947 RepID=A0AAD7X6U6_9APHY|nr:hypothetical protein C8Q70DRAFT_1122401 [Cubamyces menziesii]KAJ8462464.1 hypothetical protein ONZ51_g10885 [Trametes cubensis]